MSRLVDVVTALDPEKRNAPIERVVEGLTLDDLLRERDALDRFRDETDNLYEKVRALFFLAYLHRYALPQAPGVLAGGAVPYRGYEHLLKRRFEEAIESFLREWRASGPADGVSSALAEAYHKLGFQTLADQVRASVRASKGNRWMFRTGHPDDYPLRVRPELLRRADADGAYPLLRELTPVRMDFSHSGWSDIFFLGMDYPEGARVVNASIDLVVKGAGEPKPPVEAWLRVIDRPVVRLASADLQAVVELTSLRQAFDFAADYLGLLRAGLIAAGVIPAGMEGTSAPLERLLERLVGPGAGLELTTRVNGIPKGSRLAVSTSLLASVVAVCMRATGQTRSLTGALEEKERRVVAARAILGEWLGGSGGGWQDSGGVWRGVKLISGAKAEPGDPEYGVSRGRLLPNHRVYERDEISEDTRRKLSESLVLAHGGMAQDVGPVLEMVTEKYLLRLGKEWRAREEAGRVLDEIVEKLKAGDVRGVGAATNKNFFGPVQSIIPWASNLYTERIVERMEAAFGADFWGFWMLGGMAGGGMGFMFDPARKEEASRVLLETMREEKRTLERAAPFAMDPVVYDFRVNERGAVAELLEGSAAFMPREYYLLVAPALARAERGSLSRGQRGELERFGAACRSGEKFDGMLPEMFDRLFPRGSEEEGVEESLDGMLDRYGFDAVQHERIRSDMRAGRIGLAQNRLPVSAKIEDARPEDVFDATGEIDERYAKRGARAIADGEVAVVTLAAGAGSRWTQGAGVVKAINAYAKFEGKYRTFVETHLAKSRKRNREFGVALPHAFTTGFMTHDAIEDYLKRADNYGYEGATILSPGRNIGLRFVPTARDLRFAWEETPQQLLDERKQQALEGLHNALLAWARQTGEASDYTDNLPRQCVHPTGHWYEVPNMLLNGALKRLLDDNPSLKYLLVHNIDTLGADVDPALLGWFAESGATTATEVIHRRIEDRGGGLARVNGETRLVEGMALPREEIEFGLSYYNSATTWTAIDKLLAAFGITRAELGDREKTVEAVRALAARMPTYLTLKDVKKRWGKGQEDVFPTAQFEKLWGDMTALEEIDSRFVVVPRTRGQQLKEPAQLDGWLRDGSAERVNDLCEWT